MYRYKCVIEYIGTAYCGWQRQKSLLSLQQILEDAIFEFTKEYVSLSVAGRTDAGVHAYAQVVHFDLNKKYKCDSFVSSINYFLRLHTIVVISAEIVDSSFHARFSAKLRHYVYRIFNRRSKSIVYFDLKYWVRTKLNLDLMAKATVYFCGYHDFKAFTTSDNSLLCTKRTIDNILIKEYGPCIDIYISAPSFLQHMVRNIVGSIIMVGKNRWTLDYIHQAIVFANKSITPPFKAPSKGLYFLKVDY